MITYENLYSYSKIKANNRFKTRFSFLKLGDPKEINFFGSKLLKKIKGIDSSKILKDSFLIAAPPTKLGCTAASLICDYLRLKIRCPAAYLAKRKPLKYYSLINNRRARKKIIDKSMSLIKPKFINNKKIILVDDVLSSGCTVREVIRVLSSAGFKDIYVYTILKIDCKDLSVEGREYGIFTLKNTRRFIYLLNKHIFTSTTFKNLIKIRKLDPIKFKNIMHQINKKSQADLLKNINKYKLSHINI